MVLWDQLWGDVGSLLRHFGDMLWIPKGRLGIFCGRCGDIVYIWEDDTVSFGDILWIFRG